MHLYLLEDHMLSIEYTAVDGWLTPRITPYQNLSLDPATCVFHYGFECFEGMKAFMGSDGKIRLFRPGMNMERLNRSAERIALPSVDGNAFLELIKRLVRLDRRFLPKFVISFFSVSSAGDRADDPHLQLPRLFALSATNPYWHPAHAGRRPAQFCSPVCYLLAGGPLLFHRI